MKIKMCPKCNKRECERFDGEYEMYCDHCNDKLAEKYNEQKELLALAEKAAEELEGTCKAIYELGEEYEQASQEQTFCNRLDELVFECQVCNWWYEQSQMANRKDEDWICEDCTEDHERT